jgi:hypothetical protein
LPLGTKLKPDTDRFKADRFKAQLIQSSMRDGIHWSKRGVEAVSVQGEAGEVEDGMGGWGCEGGGEDGGGGIVTGTRGVSRSEEMNAMRARGGGEPALEAKVSLPYASTLSPQP